MKKIAVLGDTLVNDEIYGIQRYAFELMKQIDKMNLQDTAIYLIIPKNKTINYEFQRIKVVNYGGIKNPFLWRQISFVNYAKKNNCEILDLTLGLTIRKCDYVCLHDCIFEEYKEDFKGLKSRLKRLNYLLRTKIVVKNAKQIITVSETSAKILMRRYKVKNKIYVVYNGWEHYSLIKEDFSIFVEHPEYFEKKYFFALGSNLPHKNIKWIVEAAIHNPQYNFIVTGTNKFLKEELPDDIKNLFFTGYLKDSYVKALMIKSEALILPSFMEGFGIPPLEALSCGTSVIISHSSCLPEIYKNYARYIDPYNYDINMDNIMKLECDHSNKILDDYSWEKSATRLVDIIKE